jgi:hypothetical protein
VRVSTHWGFSSFPLHTLSHPSIINSTPIVNMLDLSDFVTERGGDIKKIKESQQKRFAPEETVDEVIALYEEARRGMAIIILPVILADIL